MNEAIIAWIRRGLEQTGKTQSGLAEALNTADSAVSKMLKGGLKNGINVDDLPKIASYLGVPCPYLIFGDDGAPTVRPAPEQGQSQAAYAPEPSDEPPALRLPKEERLAIGRAAISSNGNHGIPAGGIPQIDASIGMGHADAADAVVIPIGRGETMLAHPVRDIWVIPPAALRRFTRATLGDLHLVECEGDSMEPAFRSGDFVLVDTSRKVPSPPGVYALWDGHGMTLKKAELVLRSDPPMVRLIPENKEYQAYELLLEEVNFVGRVVARISAV